MVRRNSMEKNLFGFGRKYCPVCRQSVTRFEPIGWDYIAMMNNFGYIQPIFQGETFDPVNYFCPICKASDRDRLYALFLEQFLNRMEKKRGFRFIDFAPSRPLSLFLKTFSFLDYRSADLFSENVDDRVDIMDLKIYETESVDFFLCSHVLEHVTNDRKAISELYRILKGGAMGILMVPIILTLQTTCEDPSITSPEMRWKYFGQDDHLRIYAKNDFLQKVQSAGFLIHQLDRNFFGAELLNHHGIHNRSVLYIVQKK
jgi:SAM-dependent methyltransferase